MLKLTKQRVENGIMYTTFIKKEKKKNQGADWLVNQKLIIIIVKFDVVLLIDL
jgi:hypothetical protein